MTPKIYDGATFTVTGTGYFTYRCFNKGASYIVIKNGAQPVNVFFDDTTNFAIPIAANEVFEIYLPADTVHLQAQNSANSGSCTVIESANYI